LSENGFVDGQLIFSDCSKTKLIGCSTLATVVEMPESITEIGDCAFADCSRLTSIVIPNSVKKIGERAFSECREIKSIVIGNSVNEIGNYAFHHCTKLDSITIPNSVTKIGYCAFEGTGWYNSQTDDILYLDGWCIGCKEDTKNEQLSIKEGTKGIASNAFVNRYLRINSVIFPKSILFIGDNPFEGYFCNVTSYSNSYIVENNLLLTKDKSRLIACLSRDFIVKIPKETIYIDTYAFYNACAWAYDTPPYLICINNEIMNDFYYGYAKFIVPNDNIKQNLIRKGAKNSNIIVGDVFIDEYGAFYSKDKTKLICYPCELKHKEYHIIEGCKTIMEDAFNYEQDADDDGYYIYGNSIDVIHFPESLETIEKNGLQGCSHLKAIKYPKQRELFIKNLLQSYSDAWKSHSKLINIMQPELQSE
jgi:hypothetical protein